MLQPAYACRYMSIPAYHLDSFLGVWVWIDVQHWLFYRNTSKLVRCVYSCILDRRIQRENYEKSPGSSGRQCNVCRNLILRHAGQYCQQQCISKSLANLNQGRDLRQDASGMHSMIRKVRRVMWSSIQSRAIYRIYREHQWLCGHEKIPDSLIELRSSSKMTQVRRSWLTRRTVASTIWVYISCAPLCCPSLTLELFPA